MHVITAVDANDAFAMGIKLILRLGIKGESRNGAVLRVPTPVITEYISPIRRVLFCKARRPNPYFHLMESMWMLAGRNDLKFVSHYNNRMSTYSDDGATQPAAYGHRWIWHFGFNQIMFVINELKKNPDSRRAAMAMWDPRTDVPAVLQGGADVPCNTNIYFIRRPDGKLDMTVTNRSNDAIWGAYGANLVHMSFLHEFVALATGLPIGSYYQVSNDLHAYTNVYNETALEEMAIEAMNRALDDERPNGYLTVPLIGNDETLDDFIIDLHEFFHTIVQPESEAKFKTVWFDHVVTPMHRSWEFYKIRDKGMAQLWANSILAEDWRASCLEWLEGVKW